MEGAGDLLVKEYIAHRILNIRIESNRKFPDIPRACICIENFIQTFCVIRSGF